MHLAPWVIGKMISPFTALFLIYFIAAPIKRQVQRRMSPGRLKSLLLMKVN